jgi:hypothetical protein
VRWCCRPALGLASNSRPGPISPLPAA